jgi:hypothetical protein
VFGFWSFAFVSCASTAQKQITKNQIPIFINFEFFFRKMLLSIQVYKVMASDEEKQEEVSFKVSDRRKFNPDGSLKEGVVLEPAGTATAAEPAGAPAEKAPANERAGFEESSAGTAPPAGTDYADGEDGDIPGVDDPASFVNFLSTLATNAAAALGAVPHPATGQRTLDLETGKYWLDVLGMLRDKTKGNLHPQENRLVEDLLADLRMQYVRMVRATEDKLKAQAAQKFSGADILGKK